MAAYKQKDGKVKMHLVPPEMEWAFAEVGTFGVEKLKRLGIENPERNWEKGLKLVEDHLAAAKRHMNKWQRGIDNDEESNLSHMKHALWHVAAIVTMIDRGRKDLDDRVYKGKGNFVKEIWEKIPTYNEYNDDLPSVPEFKSASHTVPIVLERSVSRDNLCHCMICEKRRNKSK